MIDQHAHEITAVSEEAPVDYFATHLLLLDNLMLSTVVDIQGRLVGTNFSVVVGDFSEQEAREVTDALMRKIDFEDEIGIRCYFHDLRDATKDALGGWVDFRLSVLDEDGDQVFATLFGHDRMEQCL